MGLGNSFLKGTNTMKNRHDADTLIAGVHIATKILNEWPDIEEGKIDAALDAAYITSTSPEEWERETRMRLGLNPYWRDNEEGPRRRKEDR